MKTSIKKTPTEQLEAIYNSIGEYIFNASDEEILEDMRQEGTNIEQESARLKALMLEVVDSFERKKGAG